MPAATDSSTACAEVRDLNELPPPARSSMLISGGSRAQVTPHRQCVNTALIADKLRHAAQCFPLLESHLIAALPCHAVSLSFSPLNMQC